ncbi:response regulator [Nitrincola tapanii]|uniref:response regulator n=1 Tax=Nitrincola tapanii TaxID=1708751 RepID=UPI00190F24EA|nr:response regulator [Nitrincola tapanii]
MEDFIKPGSSIEQVRTLIRGAATGSRICCQDLETFELAKRALVAERALGVTLQLVDEEGYISRQVTSKSRSESLAPDSFNDRQLAVIRALEKVFEHCQKEGIQLVGFSDELVAQRVGTKTNHLGLSAGALDLDTHGMYRGADLEP